jgi:cell division protein FtsB
MSSLAKIIVALSFFIGLMAIGSHVATNKSSQDYIQLQAQVRAYADDNAKLRTQNEALASYVEALKTQGAVIEHRARADLKVMRPDEVLILLNQPAPGRR